MYPQIVDMNENESSKYLRMLELDAFSNMLAAFRAQGPPTSEKLKLLKDVGTALRIPQERCKAEIRKVILDERLNTIAYFSCGQVETSDDWIKEGRRLISLMPRVAPQTVYSAVADEASDATGAGGEQFASSGTHADRKRLSAAFQVQSHECGGKSQQFRVPDLTFKSEDNKKRKLSFGVENSSSSQHLIGPSKISSVQQLYRQRMKIKTKEQLKLKPEQDQFEYKHHVSSNPRILQHIHQRIHKVPLPVQSTTPSNSSPKINILQNISLHPYVKDEEEDEPEKMQCDNDDDYESQKEAEENNPPIATQLGCSNENQAPKQQQQHHQQAQLQQPQQLKQTILNIKPNNIMYKHVASPGPSSDIQKSLKICTTNATVRKTVTKAVSGQKLIIVSNAQTITTPSILQRTLTIPFVKNISVKNFDKFKIVSTTTNAASIQLTTLTNTNAFSTNSAKHKVLTVRTTPSSTAKKIIPLAHLQTLSTKGGNIKMLPVSGKLLTKTQVMISSCVSPPVYIMNSAGNIQQAQTKSTASTSVIMTCKPQESIEETFTTSLEEPIKIEAEVEEQQVVQEETAKTEQPKNDEVEEVKDDVAKQEHTKSNEHTDDIESKISQLTAIPYLHSVEQEIQVDQEIVTQETTVQDYEVETPMEDAEHQNLQEDTEESYDVSNTYILLDKDEDSKGLLKDGLENEETFTYDASSNGEYGLESRIKGDDSNELLESNTSVMDVQNSIVVSDL